MRTSHEPLALCMLRKRGISGGDVRRQLSSLNDILALRKSAFLHHDYLQAKSYVMLTRLAHIAPPREIPIIGR